MRKRILLLEDEQAIADTLLYALQSEGFEVRHVGLAREALSAFEEAPPDLAILDVGVPDGNGFDVCRAIRKTSELPIVFLTARHEEIDRVLGLELGADDYVVKPFSPREVCARVRAILRRSAAGGARPPCPRPPRWPRACSRWTRRRSASPARANCWRSRATSSCCCAALLRRPQRIFSRTELMDLVWGGAPHTSDRTVDAHIKLLRAKLRERGLVADVIQTHRHMGYSLRLP